MNIVMLVWVDELLKKVKPIELRTSSCGTPELCLSSRYKVQYMQ